MIKRKLLIPLALLGIAISSCDNGAIYDEFHHVSNASWHKDSVVTFEVVIDDTTAEYGIVLQLRHNTEYPYQNLWLSREILFNGESMHADRINYQLAQPDGKWLGDGFGALKTVEAPYNRNKLRFPQRGTYQFRIEQRMREEVLTGIEDIGLRILPLKEND
ncbi:gliding motility lipoprotein GldH [Phaeocystidibacter luteus]|nr:gliding motility lipoprotein GldH [Phaeocystidibacter luteus]